MAMKVFSVGDVLAASDVNEYLVNTKYVEKPPSPGGDTSRASNTTLTNDPDLSLAVDANKKYEVAVRLQYLATNTPNLKISFTVPGSTTFAGEIIAIGTGGSVTTINAIDAGNPVTATYHIAGVSPFDGAIKVSGILTTAGTGGNFTLQWAQDTSSAATTIIRGGSSMLLRRVA